MKKTFLVLALATGIAYANAQKVNDADVPAAVKTEFKSLYAGVNEVKWEKEKGNYEGNFKKGKTEMSVLISPGGKLVETETSIANSELPKAATDYLAKNFPGKTVKEAAMIKDAAGKIRYEAEVKDVDYTFDSKGNFVSKEEDND